MTTFKHNNCLVMKCIQLSETDMIAEQSYGLHSITSSFAP